MERSGLDRLHVLQSDVVTALPHAFYPESSWRDDMELGAAELALAAQDLGDARATGWLRDSARWASGYMPHGSGRDTLNLYDVSALAHADLIRAMRRAGTTAGLAVSIPRLEADLRSQLEIGAARASTDPFAAGAIYSDFDAASHAFGLDATAQLYRHVTGDSRYAGFATRQRDWALGANAWGVSLMIGEGTRFPQCPQHVVANLSGSLDGSPPVLRGAVVNGPNDRTLFEGDLGEFFDNAPRPARRTARTPSRPSRGTAAASSTMSGPGRQSSRRSTSRRRRRWRWRSRGKGRAGEGELSRRRPLPQSQPWRECWRRGRDSNPRWVAPYRISSAAP